MTVLPVTIVNHLAIDIAASPDALWMTIRDAFAGHDYWRAAGYTVEGLDDPTAVSAYQMRMAKDGVPVDERFVRVTENDPAARRISLVADFVSQPNGVLVYATYQAREIAGGTRYTIDCHTRIGIEMPSGGDRSAIAATIAELKAGFDSHLTSFLRRDKAKLESLASEESHTS